jgi:hypothetical protein
MVGATSKGASRHPRAEHWTGRRLVALAIKVLPSVLLAVAALVGAVHAS